MNTVFTQNTKPKLDQQDQTGTPRGAGFFLVRPAGSTHLEVKVLYSPAKGQSEPNGEGSRVTAVT